jgi:hypothetical protein
MMANKGYSTSDASVSALAAVLANILTEADTEPNLISVSYSPTPVFNAADSNGFQMTLAGNITSSTISGVTTGQLIAFYFAQDSVGGRTVSWPSSFVGALQPDPTPYAVSVILFRSDLTGNPRAVSPMISNNFTSLNALTVAAGAPVGAVLIGNGTIYAPVANGGFTSGNNSYGFWVKYPTGHIHQWGLINGSITTGSVVNFPISFTTVASVVPVVTSIVTYGSGIGFAAIQSGTITTNQCAVEIGGSSPVEGICWSVDGY